ncbi:hypothetical protein SAMN06264849_11239 [Melghirimyces algeriensis]|uniref:Uncharacterized protein n=1 Tax=Melghirimyces algeriensis TaxID=910412 RepID=A0A521F3M2_9BACL|nr:hypothetical protein SAMN06264849_11239 [Melghirimyces algeriensis]
MDMIFLTHFHHDNFKALFLRDLLKKLCQKGFNFHIQYFSAVFDGPNDMIIDVIDTGSRMLDVLFSHTCSIAKIVGVGYISRDSPSTYGLIVYRHCRTRGGLTPPLVRRSLSSTPLKWGGFPLAYPKNTPLSKPLVGADGVFYFYR